MRYLRRGHINCTPEISKLILMITISLPLGSFRFLALKLNDNNNKNNNSLIMCQTPFQEPAAAAATVASVVSDSV